jgi:hypothetical protein
MNSSGIAEPLNDGYNTMFDTAIPHLAPSRLPTK